jgi:hypothetical protein
MTQLAIDFVPETRAAAAVINDWLAEQGNIPAGTEVARGVGFGSFELRGVTINALAQPYRFYLLKRVQDEYAALNTSDKRDVFELLTACNMAELLALKLNRNIGRANNLEVWLD